MPEQVLVRLGWGRTPGQRLLDAARRLATDVHVREAAELARLVGDSGDTRPADVQFTQPALLYWRTDGGARRGSLSQIQGYYQQLQRGRLVVQGPAGAGKTVLAIALTRDLTASFLHIDARHAPDGAEGQARGRVAVRMSAPTFDPAGEDPLDQLSTEQVADRLQDWLSNHLHTVYGLRERDAEALVTEGWILPVIDGVDEMDPPGQPPERAAALLAALNTPFRPATAGGLAPVVLTCRADRYTQLAAPDIVASGARQSGQDDVREVLQDATVVQVEPLSPAAARAYLLFRFPDPAGSGNGQSRWRPILTRLAAAVDAADLTVRASAPSGAGRGGDLLVDALRSPLRLFLAVDGYRDPTSNPGELTQFRESASLDAHLFEQLIPAAVRLHAYSNDNCYTSEQIHRYLATLARHLADRGRAGGSGTDLLLYELWATAGTRLPRYLTVVILTAIAAGPLLVLGILGLIGNPDDGNAVLVIFAGVVAGGLIAWQGLRVDTDLRRFDLSFLRSRHRRRQLMGRLMSWFLRGLVPGLLMLIYAGVVFGEAVGWLDASPLIEMIMLVIWCVVWLCVVLVLRRRRGLHPKRTDQRKAGLARELRERPQVIDSPRQLVVRGLIDNTATLLLGLVAGFVCWLVFGSMYWLLLGPVFGLALGVARSPWPRYLVACLLLGCQQRLPWRLARFLGWAYQAGMVRLAGVAVQFRHREFQEWLAADHPAAEPPDEIGVRHGPTQPTW